ncbi:MAG: amidohydrolase [Candidatus Methanomethylicota archaeon]|uniref:Amidohydrolase n=1 Tax=Thermoproteota archaeon TaxID=2056631 RepID=A0A497F137_9CREN|nr:MAG: amidohydrolase [Candidatus Verstraetearchaeota archaeon]
MEKPSLLLLRLRAFWTSSIFRFDNVLPAKRHRYISCDRNFSSTTQSYWKGISAMSKQKRLTIVDSHVHLGFYAGFNVKLSAKELVKLMNKHGIISSLVSSLPNRLTFKAVKNHPGRIYGLIWVNPHLGKKALSLIDDAVKAGFKGIKMHPLLDTFLPDQDVVYPVVEHAIKHKLPILFHCGHPPWSLPWHFGNLADRYPDATIILGHMGHGHIVYINGAIEVAKKHENILLETSAMPMPSKIKEAAEVVGADRILYGSDAPFGHPAVEILKVKVSGLNERELNMVLSENAVKVFKLKSTSR